MLYPWQAADWQRLNRERERLPNAWLFTGPTGIGKLAFAEHLAASLLCEAPRPDHAACGQCEACRWFAKASHPDFRRLTPQGDDEDEAKEGSKPTRKLPVIKIEAVREVIDFAHLTAHRAGRRIVLVEPAEALNPAAANALLKILEEPPADVLFLLVAHAPQRLLPTIKSRCRAFPLTAPSETEALAWLEAAGVENASSELAHHGGTPLFEHDEALAKLRRQFLEGLARPTLADAISLAEQIDRQKLPLALPLEWLQKWLHDLVGLRLAGQLRYYPDHQAALQALAERADIALLMGCYQSLTRLAPYGQHTLNVRLQLEALLMDYLNVFAARPAAR